MPPSSPSQVRGFRPPWQAGHSPGRGKGSVPSTHACQELLAGLPTTGTLHCALCQDCQPNRHWHLWGSGSTSQNSTGSPCGAAVAVPVLCRPYKTGEPAQACALCLGLGQDPVVPADSPLRGFGPITAPRAVPPSQEHCQPLSPHSPSAMGTC